MPRAGSISPRSPARLRAAFAGVVLSMASTSAMAASLCPRPTSPSGEARRPTQPRSAPTAEARALAAVDVQVERGDLAAAKAALARIANFPPDRHGTASRARLRLIGIAFREGDYDRAEAAAIAETTRARTPRQRALARFYVADARYRRGVEQANAAYDAAGKLYEAESFDAAEVAYRALLERPCPYRPDYRERVRLRLAAVALARGDFAEARRRVAIPGEALSDEVREQQATMLARIAQRETDTAARATIDGARALIQAGSIDEGITGLRLVRARHPGVSIDVLHQARLAAADAYARQAEFARGRALVATVRRAASTEELRARADEIGVRIDRREVDYNAQLELDGAKRLADAGKLDDSYGVLTAMIDRQPAWPLEWVQTAKIRRAGVLRSQRRFDLAREALTAVASEAPAEATITERTARELARLNATTPRHDFRGWVRTGLLYDTNTPAITAAIPGEESVPLPAGRNFDDGALTLAGAAEYRGRISDRYDYVRLGVSGAHVRQFTLDDFDRLELGAFAGLVYQLPAIGGAVEGGVSYDRVWRGGDFLYNDPGFYLAVNGRLGDWIGTLDYEGAARNDRRDEYDAWRQRLRVQFNERNGGWSVLGGLRDSGAEVRTLSYLGYELGAGYRFPIGPVDAPLAFAGDVSARGELLDYRGRVEDADGGEVGRRDTRLRFTAGVDATLNQLTTLRLEYQALTIDSNLSGRDRENHRVAVSLRHRFSARSDQPETGE